MQPFLSSVDAVVFDVGGTLLRVTGNPQEAALKRISHLAPISREAFRVALEAAVSAWHREEYEAHREDLSATWVQHYQHALASVQFAGDCAEAARLLEETFLSDGWEVFADAKPVLEAIRARGIPMGVVSNWPPSLEPTLERAGLRQYFSVIVSSGVAGYTKPHPRIFQLAAEGLGLEPARILYVGDDLERDAFGAAGAGMQAVLLDRTDRHASHSPRITDLRMLEA